MEKISIDSLLSHYKSFRSQIKARLRSFRKIYKEGTDADLFAELCFCICAVQNKSRKSDEAIQHLIQKELLFQGSVKKIAASLRSLVRFHNNKAGFIVSNREAFFQNETFLIRDILEKYKIAEARMWLWENVKGFGIKEASHYLRNMGKGRDLAILDVHILNNMIRLGVIQERPKSLTLKKYLQLEETLQDFSADIKVPMDELDMVLWSMNTGEVFK